MEGFKPLKLHDGARIHVLYIRRDYFRLLIPYEEVREYADHGTVYVTLGTYNGALAVLLGEETGDYFEGYIGDSKIYGLASIVFGSRRYVRFVVEKILGMKFDSNFRGLRINLKSMNIDGKKLYVMTGEPVVE